MTKKYAQYANIDLNEAVKAEDYLKAVKLVSSVIGKRIGSTITLSPLEQIIQKADSGKLVGIYGIISNGKQLRYNWKIGTSAEVHSVDVWNKIKPEPDITINTEGISLVKLIGFISEVIKTGQPLTTSLEEEFKPKTKGKVSMAIAEAIRDWSITMNVDNNKIENTRISTLFKDFEYWRTQVAEKGKYREVSEGSFRNYILAYITKKELTNIFIRTVSATKSKGEKVVTDGVQEKEFNSAVFSMNLEDQFDFAQMAVIAVLRKIAVAQGIFGAVGTGKTRMVTATIKNEKNGKFSKVKYIKGGISKPIDFYKILYDNRKNTLLVFDDVQALFKKPMEDIMKAATETQGKRIVSFYKDSGLGDYPEEFLLTSGLVFLANINKEKLSPALKRRLSPIEITGNKKDIIDRIRVNLKQVLPKVDFEIKQEVLDFIEGQVKNIDQVDFSTFERSVIYRLTEDPSWKKFVIFFLRNSN